jgi:hypothetical protein
MEKAPMETDGKHEGMKIQAKPVTLSGSATVEFSLTK